MRLQSPRAILGSASWYLTEKLVRLVGAFLIGAWVARYLGPTQYGALAFALALVATLGFLASWGIESLAVRDVVQHPGRASQIVSTYFFLRLGGAMAVPLLAFGFLLWSHRDDTELMVITLVLSLGVLLSTFEVADCWLQARHRPRSTSLIRMGGFLVGAIAKAALVLGHASLIWFACAAVAESAFIAWAYWTILQREGIRISPRQWDSLELRRLFLDGKAMVLSGLTVVIYSKIDVLAIGTLISKEALGPYAIAASMCGAWNMIGISLAQAYAPHIAAARMHDASAYLPTLRRFMVLMLAVSVAGSLLLASLSTWIFDILLGPAYARGADIFSILVWSSVPVFLGVATSQIIVNEKLYWLSFARTALGAVVSLGLIVPIATRYGVEGVAVLVILSSALATGTVLFARSARALFRFN